MPNKQYKAGPIVVILICAMIAYFMVIFNNRMKSAQKEDVHVATSSSRD